MWYAVNNGKFDEVQALLKGGAKVNIKCGLNNDTVLHRAFEKNYLKIIRILLDYGADYRALNK